MANALEGADDKARELFAVAYAAEQGKENDAVHHHPNRSLAASEEPDR